MKSYRFIARRKRTAAAFLSALLLLCGCSAPKNILYFQDMEQGKVEDIMKTVDLTVKPGDKISIVVNSRDPLLTGLFNLPIVTRRIGSTASSSSGQSSQVSCYTIDSNGEIEFPVLGKINVSGKNREQIASLIQETLIAQNLVSDPLVTVEFANLSVDVLGEVNSPGRYALEKDRVTLLDVLSMAGDLTIFGQRKNVMVLREEDGRPTCYQVDLTSARDLYSSPVYYLRQNDVVYVEPNNTRARQSTVNGNNVRAVSFWFSVCSLLMAISSFVFRK